MLKSSVRLALVASLTWAAPPVSRQMRNESTVPNFNSPRSASGFRSGLFSSIQRSFVPEK
jgi:hypothetical protein